MNVIGLPDSHCMFLFLSMSMAPSLKESINYKKKRNSRNRPPVISPVLGVDRPQDDLDEVVLRLVQDVSQVGSVLVASLLSVEVGLVVAAECHYEINVKGG